MLQEANSRWGRTSPSCRFGIGDVIANQILARPNVSGGFYAYDLYGATPQVYNIPKFYENFVRESINANTGRIFITLPLITAEEALLNRAEAYIRNGKSTEALNDLNAFISKNIDDYTSANNVSSSKCANYYGTSGATGILLAALDFKRAFFLQEGLRWFDILRLKIPVVHTTNDGEVITLEADDNRRVLQLPAVTKQAGLEPNPR